MASAKRLAKLPPGFVLRARNDKKRTHAVAHCGWTRCASTQSKRSNVFGAGFGGSEHRELQPRLVCITDWRAERENSGLHCSMACTKDAYVVTRWPRVYPEGDT
jgi:hypothetical protein